jgi:hypothetical protein
LAKNCISTVNNTRAQDNTAGIAAAIGGIVAIGAGIAAIDQLEESQEQRAVEHILETCPEITKFELKSEILKGVKAKDLSNVSVLTFELESLTTPMNRYVLFAFTSTGWANENGINYDRIFWNFMVIADNYKTYWWR